MEQRKGKIPVQTTKAQEGVEV